MKTLIPLAACLLSVAAPLPTRAAPREERAPAKSRAAKDGREAGDETRPQSAVAAKTSFEKVAATDAAVKKALEAKDLEGGRKLIGKDGAFQGMVVKVFSSRGNRITILNFAENYKDALTAVLRPADYARFPSLEQLKGQKILVKGRFEEYRGATQIGLTDPGQIRVIR